MLKTPFNLKSPVHLLAIGLGSGLLKPAPGTWGTLLAIPFYFLLNQLPLLHYGMALLFAFILGIYLCGKTAKDIGAHDHGAIVWDEFVGLWIALAFIPADANHLYWVAAGFMFFRFFDIVKPFPIGFLDKKVHGGFGIMLDDVVAGLYAMACLMITEEAYIYYAAAV